MLTVCLSRRYLWSAVSVCLTAGVLLWGCAPEQAVQPPQPSVDVSKRLAPLEECVARSQRAVTMAAEAGPVREPWHRRIAALLMPRRVGRGQEAGAAAQATGSG